MTEPRLVATLREVFSVEAQLLDGLASPESHAIFFRVERPPILFCQACEWRSEPGSDAFVEAGRHANKEHFAGQLR